MNRDALYFDGENGVEVRSEAMIEPKHGEVLVRSIISAISAGTEMLLYCGRFPSDLELDVSIGALQGQVHYPTKYGYASVGEVINVGDEAGRALEGRLVFVFQPHQSHSVIPVEDLIPVPEGIRPEDAAFLASLETGLSLLMDGRPLIGERVAVIGQGVIGLITTGLLSMLPLSKLVTVENLEMRKELSLAMGSQACFSSSAAIDGILSDPDMAEGADLAYEVSGNPDALGMALGVTGFDGRIVIGSWYGNKEVHLSLGTRFHRNRNTIISSQVSRLDPSLTGRWAKGRRLDLAWALMPRLRPSRLVTHRVPFENAAMAYRMLEEDPGQTCQVLLTYPGGVRCTRSP
jgi:2-desacetyl-2-hydroxyethyl bacteriochlorophyllide A dehydrogenase